MKDNKSTNNSQRMSKNMKVGHYEEPKAEKISRLLKRLDEIKRRIYSGEESDREELERIAKDFREAHVDPKLSINVEATVLELEGRLMEKKGNYEEAKSKYPEAAEKLVQWAELTAKELIGKSILLKATRSLAETKEAYKRLKQYIEGQPLRIEGSIQALINPTAKEKISKSYEKESSAWGKIVLKLVEMGKTKVAFTMVKYSNLERIEIFNKILDIALKLANKGEKEKAIKIIEAAYNSASAMSPTDRWDRWDILIKIALKCDEIELEVAKRIKDEVFDSIRSTYSYTKSYVLKQNLRELIENENGNIDKARKIMTEILPIGNRLDNQVLEDVAVRFAKKGATKEAFKIARLIKEFEEYNRRHYALDAIIRESMMVENVTAEKLLQEARLSYQNGEICPNALEEIAVKFAWEGNSNKALEIARSIKAHNAKIYALLRIARVPASANEELVTQVFSSEIERMPEGEGKQLVDGIISIEKSRALSIIEEAINIAHSEDAFWSSHYLSDVALTLNSMGDGKRALKIINEAIDVAYSIDDFLERSESQEHIVLRLVQMRKIKEAFETACSIEDPQRKASALLGIIPELGRNKKEVDKEVIKETKESIEDALRQGMDFTSTSQLVKEILETKLKIDLSEYSKEMEETGLFLKGQKEHPTKVAIELGWVFKNLWLARSLYAKVGSAEKVKEVDEKLKWMGRFSPLDIRPLEEEEMNLFIEREELRQLDTNIAIRNGGSIALCGERGSGKSTLLNNYLSKYKYDPDCLVIKTECSTYYNSCEFMRFLFQKVIEAIKSSKRFRELKKEERQRIEDLDEQLKFVISREKGFEAGAGLNIFHAKSSRKKSLTTYDFNHPQIITTIKNVLEEQSANFSRIFIIIDEFDKLDVGEEEDFKRIKYRILQDLRAIFSIGSVYFILIGLEKHFQFEVKDEGKTIEDSAFDDIIHLKLDNEERHHFLSEILERRLNWLNLNELFDESGKEEMVKRAKGSPRELIRLLSKAIAYWMDKGIYKFDQKTVESLTLLGEKEI